MNVRKMIDELSALVALDPSTADREVLLEQYDAESAETYSVAASSVFAGTIKTAGRMRPVVLITRGSTSAPEAVGFELEQTAPPVATVPIVDTRTALAWVRHHLDQVRETASTAADGCHQVDGDVVVIARRELAALVRDAHRPAEQWEAVLDEERHGAGLVERAADALAKIDAVIVSTDPKSAVPIADVAHVVRNALTPARHYLEQPAYMPGSRVARAIDGIDRVLAYVDRLVRDAQKENK